MMEIKIPCRHSRLIGIINPLEDCRPLLWAAIGFGLASFMCFLFALGAA